MKILTNEEHTALLFELQEVEKASQAVNSSLKYLREQLTNNFRHVRSETNKRALIECYGCGVKTLHVWCACNINCEAFYCLTNGCEADQNEVTPLTVEWIEKK